MKTDLVVHIDESKTRFSKFGHLTQEILNYEINLISNEQPNNTNDMIKINEIQNVESRYDDQYATPIVETNLSAIKVILNRGVSKCDEKIHQ